MLSSVVISKSQPSLLLSTTSEETLTSSSILSSNDTNNMNIAKNDSNYNQLKEINKINVKLRRKSMNRSLLLLSSLSLSDHSYYIHKINQHNKNQLSHYFNRSSSISSPSASASASPSSLLSNRVKHINPTLNWYSLALRLKQRTRYYNDINTKNSKLLNSSYNDDNDNDNEIFIQNTKSNSFYNKQLSENLIQLPPPSALSSQRQLEQLNKQRQQQQKQKQRKQHSKSWNDKKLAQNLLLEEWKRKSDTVQHCNNIEDVSLSTKMFTVRFWNGDEIKLHPLPSDKLEDVIRPHLSDLTIPIQCIDLANKEFIPWETPTSQLSSKTLLIKSHIFCSLARNEFNDITVGEELKVEEEVEKSILEQNHEFIYHTIPKDFKPFLDYINKDSYHHKLCFKKRERKIRKAIHEIHKNKFTSTGIHLTNTKKLERRSVPLFDPTSDALKNWFEFYKKSNSLNSYSLSDQLINECLSELNPNVLVNLLSGRQKIPDGNSTTSIPLTTTLNSEKAIRQKSNSYSRIEDSQHQNMPNSQQFDSQDLASLFFIEESWEQIVKSSSKMTKQQQKRQSAIWEFIYTEANYLKYLRTIIDYYLSPFLEIREYLFENLDIGWIFGNIEEIFKANIKLWLQYLIEPLKEIRCNGDVFTPIIFKSAITHIPDLLSVYKKYYVNLSRCRSYTQEAVRQCTNFCIFLEWADQQGHDHREPLWDQLTKPTTRLTQYRLLMESIRKNCCNSIEEQEVNEMYKSISDFIEEINQHMMTETKTWESLEMLASKLICYDFLDNSIDDYTQLISDYTRFKFSILSPIKLPTPVIIFNDYNIIQQTIPSCTKSLAFLRNRRLSGSSLFTSNNSIRNSRTISNPTTISCNRSDSGIGDCNPTLSKSSTISTDNISPLHLKQRSRIYSLTNPMNESNSFPVMLSRITEGNGLQKSISIDTELSDSFTYDWSDIYCRRTIQRTVLYGGNLRFKEPSNRSVETVCHILTDLFLITKQHKKDGNDYWKLLKSPIRLDKLIIQRGRETGVFGCAILDDFHNIANLYIFSAGSKCDEWIAQIESAKENYRKLMEPEVLVAQPLMKHQRDDLSTIIMSPDSICNSDNTSELHNQSYGCNNDYFIDSIPTTTTTATTINTIDSSKKNTIEGNKRNVFFNSQSSLLENINCNQINNNQTDSMCIIDKRIRSINSPTTIISNHQRSSSRSCNSTTIQSDSTKMIQSTSVKNLFSSNNLDHDQLNLSINQFHPSKSITISPLKRDVVKKFFLPSNQNGQKYYLINQQIESRSSASSSLSTNLNKQQFQFRSSNIDLHKLIDDTIPPNYQSSKFISSSINNHNHHHNDDYQPFIIDKKSSNSTLSLSSTTTTSSSLSKSEMKIHLNQPSIMICKVKSDSDEIINNNNNDNDNNNQYLLSTNLQRQSVHQSLLNIERSDSSEDQITIKL